MVTDLAVGGALAWLKPRTLHGAGGVLGGVVDGVEGLAGAPVDGVAGEDLGGVLDHASV